LKFNIHEAGNLPAFFFAHLSLSLSKNVHKTAKGALFRAVEIR